MPSNVGGFGFGGNPRPSGNESSLLTGLLDYYKFQSDLNSVTGNRNGSAVGTITFPDGEYLKCAANETAPGSGAISFSAMSLQADWSVSCWVFRQNNGGGFESVLNETLRGIYITSTSGIPTFYNGAFFDSTGNLSSLDTWYHLVVTYDLATETISWFINGVAAGTNAAVTIGGFDADRMFRANVTNTLDGRLDEFGIWSRKLTATQIAALYNAGAGITYPF